VAAHHHLHDDSAWYTHPFHDTREVAEAEWLLRLAHALHMLRRTGAEDTLGRLGLSTAGAAAIDQTRSHWATAPDRT